MAYEPISFKTLILRALLDQFEFSAHSFGDTQGPYDLNGIGIDFESPFVTKDILQETKNSKATKVFLAHTHPLCNDDSLTFVNAKIDPREEIAFGLRPLPLGNPPSQGDIEFYTKVKKRFSSAGIDVMGVVFSASGLWEFDTNQGFNAKNFKKAYTSAFPLSDTTGFLDNWSARMDFPNYSMELEKPKMNEGLYKTQSFTTPRHISKQDNHKQLAKLIRFFKSNGVTLSFHSYDKFGIDPVHEMRFTINAWTKKFINK